MRYNGIEHIRSLRQGGDVNSLLLQRESLYNFTLLTLTPRDLNQEYKIKDVLLNHYLNITMILPIDCRLTPTHFCENKIQ